MRTNTGKGSNHCEYRKMVESGRVRGKGRIRGSMEKLCGRVPKQGRISVRTEIKVHQLIEHQSTGHTPAGHEINWRRCRGPLRGQESADTSIGNESVASH